jgi:hypothetical protein
MSEAEARNERQLVDEVRTPTVQLVIVQTAASIAITDDKGVSRRFHPDGKDEPQTLDASPVPTNARWEGQFFVVRYKVQKDREVRYTYSRRTDPPQLVVQVQFVERGSKDVITRVYEPARAEEVATAARPPLPGGVPPTSGGSAQPPPDLLGAVRKYDPNRPMLPTAPTGSVPAQPDVPAVPGATQAPIGASRPDAELRGITKLGVVVEGLDSAAATCGVKQDAVEALVTKSLTDAGLKVARNADEDTYVYINVMTTSMSTGFCVSRYDAILFSYTTAKLSYSASPLLVQVALLRNGGVSGGAASTHGPAVMKALAQYLDGFTSRITNANK